MFLILIHKLIKLIYLYIGNIILQEYRKKLIKVYIKQNIL